ncbi:MAG: hypothetical protein HZA01_00010 [Nitrospinae bacterium]|nr:hypothetical protein [Nitrospinota bacterium]
MKLYSGYKYLSAILGRMARAKDDRFTGVGVVLYDALEQLEIAPLRCEISPVSGIDNIVSLLLKFSAADSKFHDGFHLVSSAGELTHASQYFFPPIKRYLTTMYEYGTRYRAAQYGSCLSGVLACGIMTNHYGPVIFIRGVSHEISDSFLAASNGWDDIYTKRTILYNCLSQAQDCHDSVWSKLSSKVCYGRKVIEVGPGTGKYTLRLSKLVKELTALEKNSSMCNWLNTVLELGGLANVQANLSDALMYTLEDDCDIFSFWALSNPWDNDYGPMDDFLCRLRSLKNVRVFLVTSAPGIVGMNQSLEILGRKRVEQHRQKKEYFLRKLIDGGFEKQEIDTVWGFDSYEDALEVFPIFFGDEFREYIASTKERTFFARGVLLTYQP